MPFINISKALATICGRANTEHDFPITYLLYVITIRFQRFHCLSISSAEKKCGCGGDGGKFAFLSKFGDRAEREWGGGWMGWGGRLWRGMGAGPGMCKLIPWICEGLARGMWVEGKGFLRANIIVNNPY